MGGTERRERERRANVQHRCTAAHCHGRHVLHAESHARANGASSGGFHTGDGRRDRFARFLHRYGHRNGEGSVRQAHADERDEHEHEDDHEHRHGRQRPAHAHGDVDESRGHAWCREAAAEPSPSTAARFDSPLTCQSSMTAAIHTSRHGNTRSEYGWISERLNTVGNTAVVDKHDSTNTSSTSDCRSGVYGRTTYPAAAPATAITNVLGSAFWLTITIQSSSAARNTIRKFRDAYARTRASGRSVNARPA